jgi:protein TonB
VVATPPAAAPIRISHMSEGDLVHKVLPTYPPLARNVRIQGQVVLQAVISKQGIIENLRLLSGHPMLVPAAIEAVRQWRYRPYVLNNEPVEVETLITVNFSLAGN